MQFKAEVRLVFTAARACVRACSRSSFHLVCVVRQAPVQHWLTALPPSALSDHWGSADVPLHPSMETHSRIIFKLTHTHTLTVDTTHIRQTGTQRFSCTLLPLTTRRTPRMYTCVWWRLMFSHAGQSNLWLADKSLCSNKSFLHPVPASFFHPFFPLAAFVGPTLDSVPLSRFVPLTCSRHDFVLLIGVFFDLLRVLYFAALSLF